MSREGQIKALVVVVGDFHITGVISYLETRLPRLAAECNADIALFCPGIIKDHERAQKLQESGIRIIEGNIRHKNPIGKGLKLKHQLCSLMRDNHYDVIHINSGNRILEYTALSAAKKVGIPVRIAHSHTANFAHSPIIKAVGAYYRMRINRLATDFLACSDEAGIFLFGKKKWDAAGKLALNGIDLTKYQYSPDARHAIRKSYSCEQSARVYGFVGRFVSVKNIPFLIKVFVALFRIDKNSVFWLVGDGPDMAPAKEAAHKAGIGERAVFFGARDDVPEILQGIDALLLTSTFEGSPVVLVEAQAAGIPCFVSDVVPKGAHIPGCDMTFVSLDKTPDEWASIIYNTQLRRNELGIDLACKAGYDLESSLEVLYPYYMGVKKLNRSTENASEQEVD